MVRAAEAAEDVLIYAAGIATENPFGNVANSEIKRDWA
jgi:hypothetical protein